MSSRNRKHYFNMIEVVLALAVALVGSLCVMILLPVGLNAQRDAVADNYLPDVAQELVTYAQSFYNTGKNAGIAAGKPGVSVIEDADYASAIDVFGQDTDRSGGFVVADQNGSGAFLIFQQTEMDSGELVREFEAEAVMWWDAVTADVVSGNDFGEFKPDGAMNANMSDFVRRLNIEISWPYSTPYARRAELGNVRTYSFYVYDTRARL